MESPRPTDEPQPTQIELANAATRLAIAAKQNEEYQQCVILALRSLGPGWRPWMKLVPIESDHHRHREKPPVIGATCYKVYRGEQKLTDNSRYLIRDADGAVRHADNYQQLFGPLLQEKHPSYGFERDGVWTAFDRWSVCWSALELYAPKSAEELAALRITRERNKVEKEAREWAEENPLLAYLERVQPDEPPL